MARPLIRRGTYVTILKGNGATPTEVFTLLCGIQTKSIEDTVNTSDSFNRDCANPEEISTRDIIATSRQWTLTGGGNLNMTDFPTLEASMGVIGNYRFAIGRPSTETATLNGYYKGAAMFTRKRITGDDGAFIGVDVTIESHGPWVWQDVP